MLKGDCCLEELCLNYNRGQGLDSYFSVHYNSNSYLGLLYHSWNCMLNCLYHRFSHCWPCWLELHYFQIGSLSTFRSHHSDNSLLGRIYRSCQYHHMSYKNCPKMLMDRLFEKEGPLLHRALGKELFYCLPWYTLGKNTKKDSSTPKNDFIKSEVGFNILINWFSIEK